MRTPAATILLLLSLIGNSYASDGIPDEVCEDACSTDYSGIEQKICSVMCRMGPAFASSNGRPISTGDCPELVVKTEHRKVCRTGVRTYLSYMDGDKAGAREAKESSSSDAASNTSGDDSSLDSTKSPGKSTATGSKAAQPQSAVQSSGSAADRKVAPDRTIKLTRQPGPTPEEEMQQAHDQREAEKRKIDDQMRTEAAAKKLKELMSHKPPLPPCGSGSCRGADLACHPKTSPHASCNVQR